MNWHDGGVAECLQESTAVALVRGGLASREAAAVHLHVDGCEHCRKLLATLARMPTVRGGQPAASETTDDPPLRIAERYEIGPILGAGAMGIVYQAHDTKLARVVALKRVKCDRIPDGHERLVREALAMAQLGHPSIINVFDAGVADGAAYVAMEYVDGETQRSWLARTKPTWRAISELFAQTAHGLATAHAAGLVHGDFKPDNVLVDKHGRARIADFGLARTVTEAEVERAFAGTPAYMAPEVLAGGAASPASDQYAWAVSLYEALAGQRPYRATSITQLRVEQRRAPTRVDKIPSALARIVERGLAAEPAARFASLTDAARALTDVPRRRARRILALAVSGGLVAAAAIAWFARGTSDAAAPECSDGTAELADVWNADRANAFKSAFAGQRAVGDAVVSTLDSYSGQWRAARKTACEATRSGEQSGELLDRRIYCLDQRREALRDVVRIVGALRPDELGKAMPIVVGLPTLDACSERGALLAQAKRPDDPALRIVWQTLEGQLQRGDLETTADRFDAARALYDEVVAGAVRMSWPPLEAEGWTAIGHLELQLGRMANADLALSKAIDAASRARDDRLVADTLLNMLVAVGATTVESPEAERMIKLADAAITRAGDDREQRATFHQVTGQIMFMRYQRDEGMKHYAQALALWERLPDNSEPLSRIHIYLASDALDQNDLPRALGELAKARIAISEPFEASQNAGSYLMTSCIARMYRLEFDQGILECRKALDLFVRRLGADHPDTGSAEANLASILQRKGDGAEALRHHERALAIMNTAYGPDHPQTMLTRKNFANALGELGHHERARDQWKDLVAACERGLGKDHPKTLEAITLLGNAEIESGDARSGIARLERVLPLLETKLGRAHDLTVTALIALGMGYKAIGERAVAVATYERGKALLLERAGPDDLNVALIIFDLAEIVREDGRTLDALRMYDEVERVWTKGLPITHPLFGHLFTGRGEALLALRRTPEATAVLERALSIRLASGDPVTTAHTELVLAESLLPSNGDRARTLVATAGAHLDAAGPRGNEHRAHLDRLRIQTR